MKEEELIKINYSDKIQKVSLFIIGTFLSALAFNLFLAPYNIVTGGISGVSLVVSKFYNIDISLFVLILSLSFLFLSLILLDKKSTLRTIAGSLLFPFFLKSTAHITNIIDLGNTNIVVILLYGGIISGFATGLILKTGYTTGGFHVLYQIIHKYFKISIGNASILCNGLLIVFGGLVYGMSNLLYAIVVLYISSLITDRVILGVSDRKSFYIVTEHEKEIREFIVNKMHHSFTVVDVKGGYTNDKKKMIMCVIPTYEYVFMKEVILSIDKDAFFLITDAYETLGDI